VAEVPNGLSLTAPQGNKKIKPKAEDINSSETWVNVYPNLRRNNVHSYHRGILKYHDVILGVRAALISVGEI
jgi:hypothetical protein